MDKKLIEGKTLEEIKRGEQAQKILDNPEEFVGAVVEKQVSKAFEKLQLPKLNTEKFKLF